MASILTRMNRLFSYKGARPNGNTNGTVTTYASPSHAERHAYWQSRQDIPREEHMAQWERQMDDWLAGLNAEQQAFLKRLLRQNGQMVATVQVSAHALYTTLMLGEGNGDLEYFAAKIVATNSRTQIEEHQELIVKLAKMYGDQSSERALPLIAGYLEIEERRNGQMPSSAPSAVLGFDGTTGMEVAIAHKDRQEGHVYLCGVSGMGASRSCSCI